jgi:hypothetical protein
VGLLRAEGFGSSTLDICLWAVASGCLSVEASIETDNLCVCLRPFKEWTARADEPARSRARAETITDY